MYVLAIVEAWLYYTEGGLSNAVVMLAFLIIGGIMHIISSLPNSSTVIVVNGNGIDKVIEEFKELVEEEENK